MWRDFDKLVTLDRSRTCGRYILTKRKLRESGADGANNCMRCFECVFGEKTLSRRLWPLVSPTDPVLFLLLIWVQEKKKQGNNPRTVDCLEKKRFQNAVSSPSPAESELADNVYFLRCVSCLRAEGKHYRLLCCLWQVNLSVSYNTLNKTFLVVCEIWRVKT